MLYLDDNRRPTHEEALQLLEKAQKAEDACLLLKQRMEEQLQEAKAKLKAAEALLLEAMLDGGRVRHAMQKMGYHVGEEEYIPESTVVTITGCAFFKSWLPLFSIICI